MDTVNTEALKTSLNKAKPKLLQSMLIFVDQLCWCVIYLDDIVLWQYSIKIAFCAPLLCLSINIINMF